ncbi:hypothetical protein [Moritella marina]
MRITKPTNNANISLLLIVTFLIACMVNNAYTFNNPQGVSQGTLQSVVQDKSTVSAVANAELYNDSYLDNSDGVC